MWWEEAHAPQPYQSTNPNGVRPQDPSLNPDGFRMDGAALLSGEGKEIFDAEQFVLL